VFFEETIKKTRIWIYAFTVECETYVRKFISGNGIKSLSVRKVGGIASWNTVLPPKVILILHNELRQNSAAGLSFLWRNSQHRSVGRRKTSSGSWLLHVKDTAEGMINVAFIDSNNHTKAACAVRNRYAEHFCPQTWWRGSDNDLNRHCSYSGKLYVVNLWKLFSDHSRENYYKTVFSTEPLPVQ